MRRILIALLAALVLSLGACADSGSSSSSSDGTSNGSSSGSSSDGSSSGSSSDGSSSDGSSSSGSSSDGGSGDSSSGGGGGGTDTTDGSGGATPTTVAGFTTPEPRDDGTVEVPEEPPKEIRDKSPLERLRALPPVPRSCLDDDLTLLDIFVPGAAIPVRLLICLLYIGTILRVPDDFGGGSSSAQGERATTSTDDGERIEVRLVPPNRVQRPLLTIALLLLIVAVSITIGYVLGRRRAEQAQRIEQRARGL